MLEAWQDLMPAVEAGDMKTISAPIDFLGVNNYTSPLVGADETGGRSRILVRADVDRTDMGWEVVPEGLHDLLVRLHNDYEPPAIYITENGAAFADVRGHDGNVLDPERESYLNEYVDAAGRAIAEGVAPGSAATSPGRCSTTSSGRGATGSGSGSSTSTSRHRSGCPRAASTGIATSSPHSGAPPRPAARPTRRRNS